ncbi:nitroreductase family protein [Variovorax humicola]|uniref:Nitroreductase family protein n=1 Tax=Variovorax humicola TaxID=1769758 RepID=A0ABU8W9L9_9BURK
MSVIPLDLASDAVVLPAPQLPSQASLHQTLRGRRSTRSFRPDPVSLATLSALLWAACGINREQTGGRTAPSARGWKEVDIYAVLPEGAYRYEPEAHRLALVSAQDLRGATGVQDFVGAAPLNLVYVAHLDRMVEAALEDRPFLAGTDTGFIAQNVYLCCAAMGLGTVVRAMIDRRGLAKALQLPANQRITLAQTVGWEAPGP